LLLWLICSWFWDSFDGGHGQQLKEEEQVEVISSAEEEKPHDKGK